MQTEQFRDLGKMGWWPSIGLLAEEIFSPFLEFLPFFIGSPFRWIFLKIFALKIGKQPFIAHQVSIRHCYALILGDYVGINQGTIIHCRGGVVIGDHVFIGQRVIINTGDHLFTDKDRLIRDQGAVYKPVKIGNDVFIGMGAMILPGVTVAEGTVVAAGAVVARDTEPYSVVAGIPAQIIKRRTSQKKS